MESIITKGTQKNIDIKKIKKNPLNTYNAEELDDLKNSIVANGLITPISVIGPDAEDQYTLIAGERRLNIYTELFESGKEEYGQLPAYIVGNADMGTTEQQLLIEASNLDTRDGYDKQAHYLRVVKLIKQYGTEQGLSCHEYTKLRQQYMKCSPRYARFYEQVFEEGTEALQEMVEKGEVSVSRAGRLANMPDYMQESAIQDLKAGMNQDEVIKKYSQMRREEKEQQKAEMTKESDAPLSATPIPATKEPDVPVEDEGFDEIPYDEPTSFEEDFDDIDFNTLDTGFLNCDTMSGAGSKIKNSSDDELHSIISWCNRMLSKKVPTEEEWEAIEACRKVANKF